MNITWNPGLVLGAGKTVAQFVKKYGKGYLLGGDPAVLQELEANRAVNEQMAVDLAAIRSALDEINQKELTL